MLDIILVYAASLQSARLCVVPTSAYAAYQPVVAEQTSLLGASLYLAQTPHKVLAINLP